MDFLYDYNPSHAYFLSSLLQYSYYNPPLPQSYVNWVQTPDSHLFSANLPGMRKEEIRVEVEDSRYLVIRTENSAEDESTDERLQFMRKFRLPEMVAIEGISAGFEDGVLTVTVPRVVSLRRRRPSIDPAELARAHNNTVARAA